MIYQILIRLILSALLGFFCHLSAQAQTYPAKSITMVVPYGPGSGNDMIARELSQKLTEQMGVTFVVENKAGATGNIGLRGTSQT